MTKADLKVGQVFKAKTTGLSDIVELTLVDRNSLFESLQFAIVKGGKCYKHPEEDGTFGFPINAFLNSYELING
tara:strand:- start:731 stop:952 length:222 start_codon:yes stop_codon:yes gene_type:complete